MKQLSIYDTDYEVAALNDALSPVTSGAYEATQATNLAFRHDVTPASNLENDAEPKKSQGNITEIIVTNSGTNPIEMILPMLTHLSQEKRWLAWVNPPRELCQTCRSQNVQLNIEEIMLLNPGTSHSSIELAEKALATGTCHAVVIWTDGLGSEDLRKLERASEKGRSHGIILRNR